VLENIIDGLAPADPATLRTMLAQVERLGRLVAQLLDLSRLESGAVPLQREDFEVAPVLEEVAALARLHAEAEGSGVQVTVRVEGRSPIVDGDAERVHQVVANLVENAVRCSPAGGTVELTASAASRAVTIAVCDEGPGISPDKVDRVFERFYRADPARSSTSGGAGLGLAIARWIVDLHGGQIRPEPVRPHGCRMVVVLPRGTAR
jgi:signal transduction histidine kinase